MASVWIARQTGKHGFRRLVAVKTILPKFAAEPQVPADVRRRGADRVAHRARQRRADPRRRRAARRDVPRDGVRRRRCALEAASRGAGEGAARSAGHPAARHGRRVRRAACGSRAARRARPGARRRASRRLAAERPRDDTRRREAHRLRDRQGARPARGRHERRSAQGQGAVHGARASARPADRPARGRLGRRRRALPPAHRQAAVPSATTRSRHCFSSPTDVPRRHFRRAWMPRSRRSSCERCPTRPMPGTRPQRSFRRRSKRPW